MPVTRSKAERTTRTCPHRSAIYQFIYNIMSKLGVRGDGVHYIGGGVSLPAPFTHERS